MVFFDISWPITNDMTTYKNKSDIAIKSTKQFEIDNVRETQLCMGSHTGTHIDAPAHFLRDGVFIDQIALDALCGACIVLDCTHITDAITVDDLHDYTIPRGARVLLKTPNSTLPSTAPFKPDFTYLRFCAAQYLVAREVRAVGIDYLGIERNQPGHETHVELLSAGIPIIEGLRLADVRPGNYELLCLPLNLRGLDAAPARAILVSPG